MVKPFLIDLCATGDDGETLLWSKEVWVHAIPMIGMHFNVKGITPSRDTYRVIDVVFDEYITEHYRPSVILAKTCFTNKRGSAWPREMIPDVLR